MNLIFALLVILTPLTAFSSLLEGTLFHGYKSGRDAGSFVANGDFVDLRVLEPHRRSISYWMVKKGKIKIEHFFERNQVTQIRITKVKDKFVDEIYYKRRSGKLLLVNARRNKLKPMAGSLVMVSPDTNVCKMHDNLFETIKGVSKELNIDSCSQNLETSIIDPKCKTVCSPQEYNSLRDAYIDNLMMPDEENPVASCLKKPETAKTLSAAYGITEPFMLQTQIEIIDMKFKLSVAEFYSSPKSMGKKITCERSANGKISASTQQDGTTTYFCQKESISPTSSRAFGGLVMHELFHVSDVINEETTEDLVNICFNGATKVEGRRVTDKTDIAAAAAGKKNDDLAAHAPSQSTTLAQHQQADTTTSTKITTDIALTAVPETVPAADFAPAPAALAQTVIDSGSPAAAASPDYPMTYARVAMQQGASAIRSAQSLLSAAGAAVLPLANASTNGLRAPAAVSKPSIYIPPSSASSGAASARVASADSDFASGSDALPTGNAQKNLKAGRSATGPEVGSRSANSAGSAPSTGSTGGTQGAGSSGASGSSYGTAISGGSYTPGQANQAKRRPASVDRKEQQSIIELLSKPTAYRIAKKKLDDTAFVQKLEKNGIVIFKNDGTYKGDPSAAIKYSDKGNRFVREDK
jgi:hypothetical protein